ncbi:hypothetical protein F3Y22_tig00110187pilonHSYRG00039 [Hibiscus syriacus]|uniref:Uncharacterized protein n=1 Tax=Hibiscus syriacus TaxID=106335 RepID=A0A6A3BF89_HIBSY|nr:hypothetical protein F3Y22_tig00110187pilonHSYRG00039 [Hibiscus syriacus]
MVMKQLLAFAAAVLASSVVSSQGSEFAFYKLSLKWPSSVCISAPQNSISPIPKIFTIHGLWLALKNDTSIPPYDPIDNNCNPSPVAPCDIVGKLTPIKGRLQQNLIKGTTAGRDELF